MFRGLSVTKNIVISLAAPSCEIGKKKQEMQSHTVSGTLGNYETQRHSCSLPSPSKVSLPLGISGKVLHYQEKSPCGYQRV